APPWTGPGSWPCWNVSAVGFTPAARLPRNKGHGTKLQSAPAVSFCWPPSMVLCMLCVTAHGATNPPAKALPWHGVTVASFGARVGGSTRSIPMKKFVVAALCTVALVGVVTADEFGAMITKVETKGDTVTVHYRKKAKDDGTKSEDGK